MSTEDDLNIPETWCLENNGSIHPDKVCVMWCSLNNHPDNARMPDVSMEGKKLRREQ